MGSNGWVTGAVANIEFCHPKRRVNFLFFAHRKALGTTGVGVSSHSTTGIVRWRKSPCDRAEKLVARGVGQPIKSLNPRNRSVIRASTRDMKTGRTHGTRSASV